MKSPPEACKKYDPDGEYGHTYATTDGVLVSQLELVRAWQDAGNTPETAHYGLIVVGGEAATIPATTPSHPGDFWNVISNGVNSGLIQCDTCRNEGFDNNNICTNIWAATRVVLIPQMDPKGADNGGCIIMEGEDQYDTNVCNQDNSKLQCKSKYPKQPKAANFIGPFCHVSTTGVGWSSVDNFPNGYYMNYLNRITKGNYFSLKDGDCADSQSGDLPSGYGDLTAKCTDGHNTASTATCCTYEKAGPIVEDIAKQIADCAIEHPEITNILDCPNPFTQFEHNICNIQGCTQTCKDCYKQGPGPVSSSLKFTDVQGSNVSWATGNGLCYGGDNIPGVPVLKNDTSCPK